MKRIRKWLGWTLGMLLVLLGLAALGIYLRSEMIQQHIYPLPAVMVTADPALLARGEQLVNHISVCVDCHGTKLEGGVVIDDPAIGRIVAPNLTTGQGGIGAERTDEELARAIRNGILPDGRSVRVMPSDDYQALSDSDLSAILAYLRAAPPQESKLPASRLGPLGRTLLVLGQLPIMVVDRLAPSHHPPATVTAAVSVAYGAYLAQIAGCIGCHGPGLAGGPIPAAPPAWPSAANLTPSGAIGQWGEADFITTMRAGVTPEGKALDPIMPWPRYTGMSDVELQALWRFIQTIPAKPAGTR